jgi:hypothetical protein
MSLPWEELQPDPGPPEPPPFAPPVPPMPLPVPPIPVPVPPVQPPSQPPAAPVPTPPPVTPTETLPARQGDIDYTKILKDAFIEAMREAGPQLKDTAGDYVKQTVDHVTKGDKIDWDHPTVVATTAQGRELVVADAKSRSWRTFLQGLIFDIGFALVAVLATLSGADPFQKETWILFGTLVIKTLISTVISYVMRLKITPTIRPPAGEKMEVVPTFVAIPEEQRR